MHGVAMFFAAHVNISALAEDEQGQAGKDDEGHNNFPHGFSFKKKALTRRAWKLSRPPGPGHQLTFNSRIQSLA